MAEHWPDPERFDPERFAPHRREDKVHRHAWEPFGGGVHKCLGMAFAGAEVKLIVHQALRRFEWTVDGDYRDRLNYHSLPFPADGQPVDLRPSREDTRMSKRDISGLAIVITGAGRGIGEATAALLAAQGATVALGDLDTTLVQGVAARIGRGAVGAHLDVTSSDSWTEFLAAVGEVGPIDVLVNNAGIMPLGSIIKETEDVARAIIDVNVHGVINGTKAVAPGMVDRGHGHIVNVASAVGRIAVAEGATYSASKFAAVGFSEATRAELKPHGIDVSVVLPTVVQTELAAGVPTARGVKAVSAEDVAEVIATAIRTTHPELWVPRWVQGMAKATGVLPHWLQERIAGAFGADRVLADRDETQRTAYEARVRPPSS